MNLISEQCGVGQSWSQTGDEALMRLETFRRNGRWHLVFPHSADLSKD
jgi:hypothetical protein